MKEFKTLGPTQFGVGDGVKTRFSVARPGDIVRDSNIESVRRVGWQGDQLLRPYPRTNLAIASNDFTNSAWQGSPSLYMNFLSGTMPSSVDFSRASTATYVGRDRLIHTAAINEPRFAYDPATGAAQGLLVEGQGTNLFQWSEDFTHGAWGGLRISLSIESVTAPDGTIGSAYIRAVDSSGPASLTQYGAPTQAGLYVLSCFAKPAEKKVLYLRGANESGIPAQNAYFDLDTLQFISGSALGGGYELYPNGWVRVWMVVEHGGAGLRMGYIGVADDGGNPYDDPDAGIYIWGAQLEEGTHPTSYIPTEGSQATRIADTPTIPVGDWFNPIEGTFVVEGEAQPRGLDSDRATLLRVGDTMGHTNGLAIDRTGGTNNYVARTRTTDGGYTAFNLGDSSGIVKIAVAYTDGGDMRGAMNGGDVVTNTNSWDGTGDFLYIGAGGLDGVERTLRRANGPISRITYYPRVLSNEQLQALTS